ncbi:beta-lactamase family protein [Bradyrhizobium diazoefficiens]|nr:serine hydrolase domain-containing protein [Bradyrhizobium diazoefficiens]MBR0849168.1 beta-lactamase family protein [Bradyrhizobium diazoefficiens]
MGKLDDQIDAVFADMDKPQHPGAALLVVDRGDIICRKCYGLADLETDRPITPDTSFYLASLSKQFTAMAIMLLVDDGSLSYEDRLSTFFPQLPAWGAEISVRNLLHHTVGLPDYLEYLGARGRTPEWTGDVPGDVLGATNEAVLEWITRLPTPDFPAGSRFAYSNTGYVLLAMIVAAVSGQSFADFLKTNVFDPLGMKHTLVYDATRPTLHKLAHGYLNENGSFRRWDYPLLTAGDGGLFSTLDDLFLWDQALNTELLVPGGALAQSFTSGTGDDGTSIGYGFGWITNVFPYCNEAEREQLLALGGIDFRHVAHGGSLGAYCNYIVRFLDAKRTIIVLSNDTALSPRIRAHQVATIIFGD